MNNYTLHSNIFKKGDIITLPDDIRILASKFDHFGTLYITWLELVKE